MYVLFTPIVWFTFQYNFMPYAQFFQELCWVLALSVSLCPTLRYMWQRKNYLKKLNRTPVNSNLTEVITFLDRRRLAIIFEVYL